MLSSLCQRGKKRAQALFRLICDKVSKVEEETFLIIKVARFTRHFASLAAKSITTSISTDHIYPALVFALHHQRSYEFVPIIIASLL